MKNNNSVESEEKKFKLQLNTIINIISLILLSIPIILKQFKGTPVKTQFNRVIIGLSMVLFIVGQIIKLKNNTKEGEKIKINNLGNIIAFLVVLLLVIFYF